MTLRKPDFAPALGDLFDDLLPAEPNAEGPDLLLPSAEDGIAFFEFGESVFGLETADAHLQHAGGPGEDHFAWRGFAESLFGKIGGTEEITIEDDGAAFARPGPDGGTGGDGGGGNGGGGGKPDNGGSGGTGDLLTDYTSGGNAKTSYNITVNFEAGTWTTALQQVFIDAADYLSSIILGDVSDERVPLFGRVDDLAIDASIVEIDGAGGVLGGASVFASRVGSELPAASIMQFDVADIGQALADGYLAQIVVHEMVHAMGFGGKWVDMGLVQTFVEDGQDVLRFTGANATAEYNRLAVAADDLFSGNGVLIEMDGGPGTASVHWDDATFGDLLMTGFIDIANPGDSTLSMMSIAALEDMGYDTIYEPASDALFA